MEIRKETLRQLRNFTIALVIVISSGGVIALFQNTPAQVADSRNVTITEEGKQIVNITAKAGYSPQLSEAQANIDTTLRISTNNTYDCSSSIIIPQLNISKFLPATGDTNIDIGQRDPGTVIDVMCSMGMYRFQIKFV